MNIPLDSDNEDQLLLSRDVEAALLLGDTVEANLLALCITVLLDVLLSTLEDDTALLLVELDSTVSLPFNVELHIINAYIIIVDQTRKMVFCNSIDLGLVAKGVYASHRYLLLN